MGKDLNDRPQTPAEASPRSWDRPRASYATDPARSRGRLHPEAESATRSPFQRDRDRIIHASAFRRLKQKTQVFIATEGDHFRTRLTHSLEVAQIARSAARTLGLDEDLAEAVSLAHDLGHPPFGHAGERELHACMSEFGGFDHNAQTLRVLTKLEARYPRFDGLNLTWETLEGVVKHNGPLVTPRSKFEELPVAIQEYATRHELELQTWSGPEAQVAALADDIAYNNHDIDDGFRAGMFGLDELAALPFVGDVVRAVRTEFPDISELRWMAEVVRRLIGLRIADMIAETQRRAGEMQPDSAEDVRAADRALIAFSPEMSAHEGALRRFLSERMYASPRVNHMMARARGIVRELFELYRGDPSVLPEEWRARAEKACAERDAARVVCDYIAGMTDAFAIDEHRRLLKLDPWV